MPDALVETVFDAETVGDCDTDELPVTVELTLADSLTDALSDALGDSESL